MPIGSLVPVVLGQAIAPPGTPGGAGGPGGPAAPAPDTGWEIHVLSATDYHTLLAVVPWRMVTSLQFARLENDLGSGTIVLNMDDPFWSLTLPGNNPGHYLLDEEHLWQVWQDGVLRHEFLGETVTEQLDDPSEQRLVTVTGPGTIATLKWAMAAPPGFPDNIVYKLDAITDSFDEINAQGLPVLDTGLWNACQNVSDIALNPIGSCQLMATPGATILGTTVFDATQTLISASVTPIVSPDQAGKILDGSQLTQFYVQSVTDPNFYAMIALSSNAFYCQFGGTSGTFTKVIASAAGYASVMSNNYGYQYWQISESAGIWYFWTSPDGQNWTLQWEQTASWDALQVGFYIAATYDQAGAEYATVTSINSNVTTSSLAGALYFNQPIMSVWLQELAAAQARGTIPFVTTRATDAWDSFGNPWTDSQSVQIQNGTDLYTLLQGHASMIDAQWVMDPGFTLKIGIPTAPGVVTLGTDRSHQVIFYDSQGMAARQRVRARDAIANLLGVINTDGRTVTASDSTSIAEWGQREAWIQAAVQVTQADLIVAAEAASEQAADEVLSWTLQITPGLAGREIFTDFNVGDWIGLERPDFSAVDAVEVIGIAVSFDQDGAETHELTLLSYIQYIEQQLKYIATKMGGGFVSVQGTTAVADNGQITNLNQPTVFAPTLGALGDVQAGGSAGGNPLIYNPVSGTWGPAGQPDPVSGIPLGVKVGSGGSSGTQTVISPTGDTVVVTGPGGTVTVGTQSDGTVTTTVANAAAPATPDAPTVVGGMGSIIVGWDGLLGGAPPLSNFLNVRIYMSQTSGFTPGNSTLAQIITGPGVYTISSEPNGGGVLPIGSTWYVVLVATNQAGVASTPSAQGSAVVAGISATAVGGVGVLNVNPYFTGGDGTSWTGYDGTFSVSSAPPGGAVWPYAGFFTVTTQGASPPAAAEEAGQPFAVTPGQPYLVTAWINTPTTTCVLGLDWQNNFRTYLSTSTQSFTVTANTWTLVTTVQIAPANAAFAYIRVAPADGTGNNIYFQQIYALPQVPGSLIQAGTITATQIAADTITAAQIATGTITAQQIAAGTITASLIAAGTITATQLAANSITARNIAAGTIVAGIVNGTTVEGAQFIAYGTNGEVLVYSGTPANGNLVGSWSGAAGVDGEDNNYLAGLVLGAASGTQIQLTGGGGAPTINFLMNNASYTNGEIRMATGGFGQILIQGPATTVANFQDSLAIELNTANTAGSGNANLAVIYSDNSGTGHEYFFVDSSGVHVIAASVSAIEPGTGGSPTNAAVAETWHAISFQNGWSGSGGGVNGLFYRIVSIGGANCLEVIADIINTTGGTGNSVCGTLPSGWIPAVQQNHPAGWNQPAASNSASVPWVNYFTNGGIEMVAVEAVNAGVFFHHFVPLDSSF